jgi:hypothetical protein
MHVVSFTLNLRSSIGNCTALLLYFFQTLQILSHCSFGVHWTHQVFLVKGVSYLDGGIYLLQFLNEGFIDSFVNNESPERSTSLSGCANSAKSGGSEGQVQISIFHYNNCVVSSQFKNSSPESFVYLSANTLPNRGRSSEGDQLQTRILNDLLSNCCPTSLAYSLNRIKTVLFQNITHHSS